MKGKKSAKTLAAEKYARKVREQLRIQRMKQGSELEPVQVEIAIIRAWLAGFQYQWRRSR